MDKQEITVAAHGRCEADGHETAPAVRKRAWFYYAVARLAVARNLAVALAIAAMCVGVVGLTLWAVGAKQRSDAAAAAELPTPPWLQQSKPAKDPLSSHDWSVPASATEYLVDLKQHPELYIPVPFDYKCGHEGKFVPAGGVLSAKDPAGYKAQQEQLLCPACQTQADYRAMMKKLERAAKDGQGVAAH